MTEKKKSIAEIVAAYGANPEPTKDNAIIRASSLLAGLDSLSKTLTEKPFVYTQQWFNGRTIKLDGYRFNHCRFDNCTLRVGNGKFVLDHCVIANSTLQYHDEALRVIKLFTSAEPDLLLRYPDLAAKFHDDGTYSIGA